MIDLILMVRLILKNNGTQRGLCGCHRQVEDGQRDLVDPAVNGTKNVLSAVAKSLDSVKRVVLTSSFAGAQDKRGCPDRCVANLQRLCVTSAWSVHTAGRCDALSGTFEYLDYSITCHTACACVGGREGALVDDGNVHADFHAC